MTEKPHIITRRQIDDESIEFSLNGQHLITVNHDDDGWSGMERIEGVIEAMAKQLGIDIVDDEY